MKLQKVLYNIIQIPTYNLLTSIFIKIPAICAAIISKWMPAWVKYPVRT